jgi:cytochrome c5
MGKRLRVWALLGLLALGLWWLWQHRMGQPDDYGHMEEQYKYGSIGADHPLAAAPLPYWVWRVLPEAFPPATTIPDGLGPRNGLKGYDAFGMLSEKQMPETMPPRAQGEPAFDRPIGFSRRRVFGIDLLGMNCAACHAGTLRTAPGAAPTVVLGGVGQSIDIEQYFMYVFNAVGSKDFTADRLMPLILAESSRQGAELGWVQRLLYRYVMIPVLPYIAGALERNKFDFLVPDTLTRKREFGPGRVDTWALYKRVFVKPADHRPANGTVDFPPIWNQKAREGMRLHWDGNVEQLVERNVISALGLIGANVDYLDFPRLTRVTEWITGLLPMRYVDHLPADAPQLDQALVDKGAVLFGQHCAGCHAAGGTRTGRVEPIDDLKTDRERLKAFTPELAAALNRQQTDLWKLRDFRVQNGYVNNLLDGIWLRAPYLHNGSVPTLYDLLQPPDQRPKRFCRGGDLYDWGLMGWVSTLSPQGDGCPTSYLMDTTQLGHGNGGHEYGTGLPPQDKRALLEFMKVL